MGKTTNCDSSLDAEIERLCTSPRSISAEYAKDASKSPGDIALELYGSHHLNIAALKTPTVRPEPTADRLAWAKRCGRFEGTEPSGLFLAAYADLLQCLEHDPLANCVSPSLCGSTGVVPLTIIGPLNDQLRHMSNLIVRARREVLLATNFWKASGASTFVNDALRELSKRAGARGEKVVCKLMYDRGDLYQVFDNHQTVSVSGYTAKVVNLPAPDEIPNVDLSVVNFHRPPLGTFHSKFMIVDRQIATVSSNNVQDNDNLEMMSHLEGPIVDSLWETFLISWHKLLDPPAPCRDTPAATSRPPSYDEDSFNQLFEPDGKFRKPEKPITETLPEHMPNDPHYDDSIAGEIARMRSVLQPQGSESHLDAVARHLNKPTGLDLKPTAPDREPDLHFFPFIPVPQSGAVPMAMCSRKPYPNLNNKCEYVPQNEAWLSLIRNAKQSVFIQTPDFNAKEVLAAIIDACKRGVRVTCYVCLGYNDLGELLPYQGGTNEMSGNYCYSELAKESPKAAQNLKIHFYTAADQSRPIHNSFKQRSCHIKLLIADDAVAVQGSGNQDTQSWYHSQEVNVMIDSPVVCQAWREGIERNQNTRLYGRAREDGCFYEQDGSLAAGSYGATPGRLDQLKGFVNIFQKARGK